MENKTAKQFSKFYFTYGTSEYMDFQGGWTEVIAKDENSAVNIFKAYHPNPNDEFLINCASVYTEEQFKRTNMYKINDNLGAACQETIMSIRNLEKISNFMDKMKEITGSVKIIIMLKNSGFNESEIKYLTNFDEQMIEDIFNDIYKPAILQSQTITANCFVNIKTKNCFVNTETKLVCDIDTAVKSPGKECIILDGVSYPVYSKDNRPDSDSYWH